MTRILRMTKEEMSEYFNKNHAEEIKQLDDKYNLEKAFYSFLIDNELNDVLCSLYLKNSKLDYKLFDFLKETKETIEKEIDVILQEQNVREILLNTTKENDAKR